MALSAGVGASVKRDDPLPPLQPESVNKASVATRAAHFLPKPPPFTSVTASMDWVRQETRRSNFTAAELLFRHDARLTSEQQLARAKDLVRYFRRHDPRTLARIVLGLPRSQEADHLLWNLISTWGGEDAEGVLRFIEALPADRLNTIGVLQNAAWGAVQAASGACAGFRDSIDRQRPLMASGRSDRFRQSGGLLAQFLGHSGQSERETA